jgi:transcription antitermination factor NusG
VFAFYPSREKRWTVRGLTVRREFPEVSGYVFAQFRQAPQWHILKEERRLITGVMGGSYPHPIPRDVIRHLQGLTVEAQKLEAARREMLRVREGDKAKITDGPFAGFVVDVREISGQDAVVDLPLTGKVKAALGSLERIINPV